MKAYQCDICTRLYSKSDASTATNSKTDPFTSRTLTWERRRLSVLGEANNESKTPIDVCPKCMDRIQNLCSLLYKEGLEEKK